MIKKKQTKVGVFCGSRHGKSPIYDQIAVQIGHMLADNNYKTVYGSGSQGLMGMLADAVIAHHGTIKAVIPHWLMKREGLHSQVSEVEFTNKLSERKIKIIEDSDAFLILPGGFGTFDELFEVVTLNQLDQQHKPLIVVNIRGWADSFFTFIDTLLKQGFINDKERNLIYNAHSVKEALYLLP